MDEHIQKYIEIVPVDNFRSCSNLSANGKCDPIHVKAETAENAEQHSMHDADNRSSSIISRIVIPTLHQAMAEQPLATTTSCQLQNTAVSEDDVPSVSNERSHQTNASSSAVISNVHDGENTDDMKDDDDDMFHSLLSHHSYDDISETFSNAGETEGLQQSDDDTDTESQNTLDQKRPGYQYHTGEKPFSCNVCGKAFSEATHITRHMRTHTVEKPYQCDSCEKRFSEHGKLTLHKRVHSGERPFPCDICGRTFNRCGDLTQHRRRHTMNNAVPVMSKEETPKHVPEETQIYCKFCGKALKQSSHLADHRPTHSNEKPYACYICCKGFTHLWSLKVHNLLHTGEKLFSCGVCAKEFVLSSKLTSHKRMHANKKSHSCSTCNKSFTQLPLLTTHILTHTHGDKKPFVCDVCGRVFNRSGHLTQHRRTHTRSNAVPVKYLSEET